MPAPTPTGTASAVAIPTRMSVPTMAFAIPPPRSPTGRGSCVKNSGRNCGNPCTNRCVTRSAMGMQSTTAASVHTPSARVFHAPRVARERRARAERECGLGQRARQGAEDLARQCGYGGHDHDREHDPGVQHPEPEREALEERQEAEVREEPGLNPRAEPRGEHEHAPDAVDDAR